MNRFRCFSLIIFVLLLLLPVMAFSYNQRDLAGHWYGVGVVSGDNGTGDEEPRWEHFDLIIDETGEASGTGTDPGGTDLIDPFTVLLSKTGVITNPSDPTAHGVLNSETNFFAMTQSNDGFSLYLGMKRERTTDFDISELQGDWCGCQVVTGDEPGDDPRIGYVNFTFNDLGGIIDGTIYTFTFPSGVTSIVSGVTLTMDSHGILSQSGNTTFYGVLNDDADMITFVETEGGNNLFFLMRDNGFTDFLPQDLQGTWTTHAVVSGDRPDDEPTWWHSVLRFDDSGSISGPGIFPDGPRSFMWATMDLSPDGRITFGGPFQGLLSVDRNLFVWVSSDGGNAFAIGIRGGAAETSGGTIFNPGFENGDLFGWKEVRFGGSMLSVLSGTTTLSYSGITEFPVPSEGEYAAVRDSAGPGAGILYQDFDVPIGYTSISLSAKIYIENRAPEYFDGPGFEFDSGVTNLIPNQKVRLDLMDPNSAVTDVGTGVLENLFITLPGDPASIPPTVVSVDLTPYAGQTVRLRFGAVDNQFFMAAGLDNIQLTATLPPGHLVNPGFEIGDLFGWTSTHEGGGWLGTMSGTMTPRSFYSFSAPPEGLYAAVYDPDSLGNSILYQDFDVPTGYDAVSLSATIYAENLASDYFDGLGFDFSGVTNQKAKLDLMDPAADIDDTGAGVLAELFMTNPGDENFIPPMEVSVDLTPYAGQTVRLRLGCVATKDLLLVGLDNVQMTLIAPPDDDDDGDDDDGDDDDGGDDDGDDDDGGDDDGGDDDESNGGGGGGCFISAIR